MSNLPSSSAGIPFGLADRRNLGKLLAAAAPVPVRDRADDQQTDGEQDDEWSATGAAGHADLAAVGPDGDIRPPPPRQPGLAVVPPSSVTARSRSRPAASLATLPRWRQAGRCGCTGRLVRFASGLDGRRWSLWAGLEPGGRGWIDPRPGDGDVGGAGVCDGRLVVPDDVNLIEPIVRVVKIDRGLGGILELDGALDHRSLRHRRS